MSSNSSSVNKRAANIDASTAAENLIAEAKKLTAHGFAIIPLNDRIPIITYTKRRRQIASISEINTWFSNGNGRAPKANGIGICLNDTEFGIDTDGKECESILLKKIRQFSPELQKRILSTMHTKTPHGHHRTYKYVADDFPDGIEDDLADQIDSLQRALANHRRDFEQFSTEIRAKVRLLLERGSS